MKSLGRSNFFTKGGLLLIRSKVLPQLYSNIANPDRIIVGKVNDIIGPVMNPHIVVKPNERAKKNTEIVLDKELFEIPKKAYKERNKKWKKGR